MDLVSAIQKHAQWKHKFTGAIRDSQPLDSSTISKDNQCELGKWLRGEGKSACQQLPSFASCVSAHSAFHVEAGKIAAAINARKISEAQRMMAAGAPFTDCSMKVGVAIIELQHQMKT